MGFGSWLKKRKKAIKKGLKRKLKKISPKNLIKGLVNKGLGIAASFIPGGSKLKDGLKWAIGNIAKGSKNKKGGSYEPQYTTSETSGRNNNASLGENKKGIISRLFSAVGKIFGV